MWPCSVIQRSFSEKRHFLFNRADDALCRGIHLRGMNSYFTRYFKTTPVQGWVACIGAKNKSSLTNCRCISIGSKGCDETSSVCEELMRQYVQSECLMKKDGTILSE